MPGNSAVKGGRKEASEELPWFYSLVCTPFAIVLFWGVLVTAGMALGAEAYPPQHQRNYIEGELLVRFAANIRSPSEAKRVVEGVPEKGASHHVR